MANIEKPTVESIGMFFKRDRIVDSMRQGERMKASLRFGWWALALAVFATATYAQPEGVKSKQPTPPPSAAESEGVSRDRILIDTAVKDPRLIKNLTHLSDIIGPRLTGTPAVKVANDWAAEKMKEYGLAEVRHEAWTLPEGWERGFARGRILEPNNGRSLALASMAWAPGTPGRIEAEVVVVRAKNAKELDGYKGKLKGAAVLLGAPTKLLDLAVIEKTDDDAFSIAKAGGEKDKRPPEEVTNFRKIVRDFLNQEGAAALLQDAGKHFGLLFTTGSWATAGGSDRPSADQKFASLFVAHDHYALLYRLATRSESARTRIELEVQNRFIPGPLQSFNTVGEIRGKEKPDEFVIVGAHLDSWDLGQGILDNGVGSCVVLETARTLIRAGVTPKRTIRFVLFTGEEQGLHGSKAYVKKHAEELAKTSAALVHDTGTGKVIGLGWHGRAEIQPTLEKCLPSLKELGVRNLKAKGVSGSDHFTFDKAGVPGCIFRQEIAGYRFAHHSQADTLELVREKDLIQGVQVMAVTATRIADLEELLPRPTKVEAEKK